MTEPVGQRAAPVRWAVVDMYAGFPTSLLADGVRPNAEGHARMADVWYEAIRDLLP